MPARFARILIPMLLLSCILVPPAWAQPRDERAKTLADTTLYLLESVKSVEVGSASTVVTLKNGAKAHPIVIDYGNALGSVSAKSAAGPDSGGATSAIPEGFTLGQIGALLLGLTVVGRVVRVARQIVPARRR
jgi:hypothetical protein